MKINQSFFTGCLLLVLLSAFTLPRQSTAPAPSDLIGTWKLVAFHKSPKDTLLSLSNLHIILNEGGLSNGFLGCNHFRTEYNVEQDSLAFGTIMSSRKFCTKAYMDLEDQYLMVLTKTTRYRIHKNTLTLLAGKKKLAQLIKQ